MRGAALVVCGLIVAGVTAQDGWRVVDLEPPDGHDGSVMATCRTDGGATPLRMGSSSPVEVEAQCASTSTARCSIGGFEPIDLDMPSVCRGRAAVWVPVVRSVVPTWAVRTPATIEWREWGDSVSRLIATRVWEPQSVESWPVGAAARLLRVLRPNASPVTFVIPAAAADPLDLTVTVPAPQPGGELVLAMGVAERQVPSFVLRGAQTRIVGINAANVVAVPGLVAGDYELTFGTLDAPIGRAISVRVVDGVSTELAPRLPVAANEYRISGVVTQNGVPLARRSLEVVHGSTDDSRTVTTDDRGRYSLSVGAAGVYVVRVQMEHDLGYAEVDRPVALGETIVDLDLTGLDLDVVLLADGVPSDDVVTVVLDGPVRYTGVVETDLARFQILPAGTYVVRASAAPDLVSPAVSVVLDLTSGPQRIALDLRKQTATLSVPDTPGVRARAGQQILRGSAEGVFDVRRVSPGTEILVRAPGRVPACLLLASAADNVVSPGSAIATTTFRFDAATAMRVPPGRVRLSDLDRCTVPLEEFEWRRVDGGFEIANLPFGVTVTYEYGSQAIPVRAPSEPIVIK